VSRRALARIENNNSRLNTDGASKPKKDAKKTIASRVALALVGARRAALSDFSTPASVLA
jgi:hypothetical protein